MEADAKAQLTNLLALSPFAALGSLRDGAPFVSMVLYAPSHDFSTFFIHISGLALHTTNVLTDPRVSLLIFNSDERAQDPQVAARVSVQGHAEELTPNSERYASARAEYLKKNPQTEGNFALGDFKLFAIQPEGGRFVAGFGRIFDLTPSDLQQLSALRRERGNR